MLRQLQRDIYTSIAHVQPIGAIEYGVEESVPAKTAATTKRFVTLTSPRQSDVGCRPLHVTAERLEALQARIKWTCDPEAAVLLPEALCEGYMTTRGTRAFRIKGDVTPTSALEQLVDAPLNISEPLAVAITLMWLLREELDDDSEFDQQMHQAWITEDFVANTIFQHVFSCKQAVGVPCNQSKAIAVVTRTPSALVQWHGCTAFLGSPPPAIDNTLGQRRMLTLTDGRVAYFAPGKDVDVLAPHWGLRLVLQTYAEAEKLLKHRSKTEFELKRMIPGPPFVATFKTAASHIQTYDPLAVVGIVSAEQLYIRAAAKPIAQSMDVNVNSWDSATVVSQEAVLDAPPPPAVVDEEESTLSPPPAVVEKKESTSSPPQSPSGGDVAVAAPERNAQKTPPEALVEPAQLEVKNIKPSQLPIRKPPVLEAKTVQVDEQAVVDDYFARLKSRRN